MSKYSKVTLKCHLCGIEYQQHAFRAETSKYCSKACWSKRNPPPTKPCAYCGSLFTSTDRRSKFCSRHCARKAEVGILAHARKDGKSMERDRARLAPQLTAWRSAVYQRDHYTCQQCGSKQRLNAHHIKPWADYPEYRFDVANGITLCEDCHGKIHSKDFANRRRKVCADCGASTTGRSERCRSCAIQHWHRSRSKRVQSPTQQ